MMRIGILRKLVELQENKEVFEDLLADVTSKYAESVTLKAVVEGRMFVRKYSGEDVTVSPDNFRNYLLTEIDLQEKEINSLLEKLSEH